MTVKDKSRDKDPIAQLIQAAGKEEPIDPGIQNRIYTQVHQQWRQACDDKAKKPEKASIDKKYKYGIWFAIPAAAMVLLGVLLVGNPAMYQYNTIDPNQIVAHVEVVRGNASLITIDDSKSQSSQAVEQGNLVYEGQTITTTGDAGLGLIIGQSQSLRLDQNTVLQVQSDSNFNLLQGAVYFDSGRKGSNHHITVHTERGRFTDIGTQFELRLIDEGVQLRVREGEVAFKANGFLGKRFQVEELKEVHVTASEEPVFSNINANDAVWQWAQALVNEFKLEDSNLDEFLRWLIRENGWRLRYSDNNVALKATNIQLKGSLVGIYGEEALAAVCSTTTLICRLDNDAIVVSER